MLFFFCYRINGDIIIVYVPTWLKQSFELTKHHNVLRLGSDWCRIIKLELHLRAIVKIIDVNVMETIVSTMLPVTIIRMAY